MAYDFDAARKEYISTRITYADLAAKTGISAKRLRTVGAAEKWRAQRDKIRAQSGQKAAQNIINANAEVKTIVIDAAVKMAKKLTAYLDNYDLDGDGKIKPRDITAALRDIKELLDFKSERDIREQEARISKLIKDAEDKNDADKSVTLILGADAEELAK
jgi:hypothetical protein